MGTTAAVIAAVGTAASVDQQQKASKQSKRSQAIQQRAADERTARERRQQIRQARIQRAQIESQAVAVGATDSSSVVGAQGSLASQTASNIGFLSGQQGLSQAASAANQRAADAQTRASIFSSVSSLAVTAGTSGIFDSSTTTTQTGSQAGKGVTWTPVDPRDL